MLNNNKILNCIHSFYTTYIICENVHLVDYSKTGKSLTCWSALWVLMSWCLSSRASAYTILIHYLLFKQFHKKVLSIISEINNSFWRKIKTTPSFKNQNNTSWWHATSWEIGLSYKQHAKPGDDFWPQEPGHPRIQLWSGFTWYTQVQQDMLSKRYFADSALLEKLPDNIR